jgi:hypothetical protein
MVFSTQLARVGLRRLIFLQRRYGQIFERQFSKSLTAFRFQYSLIHLARDNREQENKHVTDVVNKGLKKIGITVSKPVLAVLCIIFGIIVIAIPDLLRWVVGIFLIIQGVLLLTEYMEIKGQQPK